VAVTLTSYITNTGITVMNKLLASKGPLTFTRGQLGSGTVTSDSAAKARTSLVTPITDAPLSKVAYEGGVAVVEVQYLNSNLTQGFFVKEIGIWCRNPDNSAQEILYCYVAVGDNGDWIAPKTSAVYDRRYKIETIIDAIQNVSVVVTPGLSVSVEDFDAEQTLVRNIIDTDVGAVYQYARAKFSELEVTREIKTVNLTNTQAYPFNNSAKTVALSIPRNNTNYEVYYEIASGFLNPGDIMVTDKLLNGFKIAYSGSATSVQLRVFVEDQLLNVNEPNEKIGG
jgi:hypothetical protein